MMLTKRINWSGCVWIMALCILAVSQVSCSSDDPQEEIPSSAAISKFKSYFYTSGGQVRANLVGESTTVWEVYTTKTDRAWEVFKDITGMSSVASGNSYTFQSTDGKCIIRIEAGSVAGEFATLTVNISECPQIKSIQIKRIGLDEVPDNSEDEDPTPGVPVIL